MVRRCEIEVFADACWQLAASVELRDGGGREDPTWLEYDPDYAAANLGAAPLKAVSVRHPVEFLPKKVASFPSFTVDLMPQGEARRRLSGELRAKGIEPTDFQILLSGARNPVGNLRVREAASAAPRVGPGLTRADVVERGEALRDWAEAEGIPMAGSTDTGGASPKYLLTQDHEGLFHADGTLPDERARRHFIVKYPRGKSSRDETVLRNEAPYLEVVRQLGLRCAAPLEYESGALFVPRFDRRVVAGHVERRGLESLYSALGVVEAGATVSMEEACVAVAAAVDEPNEEVIELLRRDIAAYALGNPDNHGRNTSLLKSVEGGIELSPIYDFAPMFLDPEGIRRSGRWSSERRGAPDWPEVVESLSDLVPIELMSSKLGAFADRLEVAPEIMRDVGVDEEVVERREAPIARTVRDLRSLRSK